MAAGAIELTEGTAPDTPGTNLVSLYAKTDKKLYYKDDDGNEHAFGHTRIDTNANKGTAANYAGEWFLEDRTGGSTPNRGDILWLSWRGDNGTYKWENWGTAV